jgi:hypothetical protein
MSFRARARQVGVTGRTGTCWLLAPASAKSHRHFRCVSYSRRSAGSAGSGSLRVRPCRWAQTQRGW